MDSLVDKEIVGEVGGGFGGTSCLQVSVADLGLDGRHEEFGCAGFVAAASGWHILNIIQVASHRLISADFKDQTRACRQLSV